MVGGWLIGLFVVHLAAADLYNSSDAVTILNFENIDETIFNSSTSWIIEFYSSWCGHCQKFAPTWKQFANDIQDWDHSIRVGVIDCADVENGPACKEFSVRGVPTIRLLAPTMPKGTIGDSTSKRTIEGLKTDVVLFLRSLPTVQNTTYYPNLLSYTGTHENLLDDAPIEAQVGVLIIEDKFDIAGMITIMELAKYSQVYIRTSGRLNEQEDPTERLIYLRWRDGSSLNLKVGKSSTNQTEEIKRILELNELDVSTSTTASFLETTTNKPFVATTSKQKLDTVFVVDIENALSYSFGLEVYTYGQSIANDSMNALRDYVHILIKYLPSRPPVHNFLVGLHLFLIEHENVEAELLSEEIQRLTGGETSYPPMKPWVGCRGSHSKYRGYPCGLWTLFHTLTVNAVLKDGNKPSYAAREVLQSIHGYVKNFFSCRHCSDHFQSMYSLDAQDYVQEPDDGIVWLWKAHNEVNSRLKGDLSEDPKFPKIQFPSAKRCPNCLNEFDQFNETNVLAYLKTIYSHNSLSLYGMANLTNNSSVQLLDVRGSQIEQTNAIDSVWSFLMYVRSYL